MEEGIQTHSEFLHIRSLKSGRTSLLIARHSQISAVTATIKQLRMEKDTLRSRIQNKINILVRSDIGTLFFFSHFDTGFQASFVLINHAQTPPRTAGWQYGPLYDKDRQIAYTYNYVCISFKTVCG